MQIFQHGKQLMRERRRRLYRAGHQALFQQQREVHRRARVTGSHITFGFDNASRQLLPFVHR